VSRTTELTLQRIFHESVSRAARWHEGDIHNWTPLEWAGAMCGEAGEAANAAKKLKRLRDGIKSINHDTETEIRHFIAESHAATAVVHEVCDTILYAVLLAASAGATGDDLEITLASVFNTKSEEYGFPERL